MKINNLFSLFLFLLVLCCLAIPGCSREEEPAKHWTELTPEQQKAKEAIRDIGKKPIDEARATKDMNLDRDKVLDNAIGQLNKN